MADRFRKKTGGNIDLTLAQKLGLSVNMLEILSLRGYDSEEKILSYLSPSQQDMSDPFEIDGIQEAADRIKAAIENKESILIYGDYDCDGISATAILVLYLKSQGINADYFIPDRNADGYGLSIISIQKLLGEKKIDLFITVDCGITAYDEVEFLKSAGVDIIVTDHHEMQDSLPNCIVVDPKIKKNGFYEFCGAGVALKLVEALSNREEVKKYFDIAAIATIADIVPLNGENRIIAYFGLKQLNEKMRKGISILHGIKTINSHDIMFRIAPKLNSAGRMDNAHKVVELFTSDDYFVLSNIAENLNTHNNLRQKLCDSTYESALKKLEGCDFSKLRLIALYDSEWESGVLGIAASRLAEQFHRPVVLFSEKEGILKGSARSISEVNLFEVLSNFKNYFLSFGGHAQAAGLSLEKDKFEEFYLNVNNYILQNFSEDLFQRTVPYDLELNLNDDLLAFAKEIEKLEPTGFGNPKPIFKFCGDSLNFETINSSKHIKCALDGVSILGFFKENLLLACRCKTNFEVLLAKNEFKNIETAQLMMRDIFLDEVKNIFQEDLMILTLPYFSQPFIGEKSEEKKISFDAVNSLLKDSAFGTVLVCYTLERLKELRSVFPELEIVIYEQNSFNPTNKIVLCPKLNFEFCYYNNVIFYEKVPCDSYIQNILKKANGYFFEDTKTVDYGFIDDDRLREIFIELKNAAKFNNKLQKILQILEKKAIEKYEIQLALQIFSELNLINNDGGSIIVSNEKTALLNSVTYRNLSKLNTFV